MKNYVIIGNGISGTTAAENIRKTDNNGNITILTNENLPCYSRIRLNEFICGEISEKDLIFKKDNWYEKNNISLKLNSKVTKIFSNEKYVITQNGDKYNYDKLLIAQGSYPFMPNLTGISSKGVFALRSICDAHKIIEYAKDINDVVIIGGGLLGLETGNMLTRLNKKVTVIIRKNRLLPRQVDDKGSEILQKILESKGFLFQKNASTKQIIAKESITSIELENGIVLPADMAIVAAGVRPNLDLAKDSGLDCNKGIIINNQFETNIDSIYAAGDITEHNSILYGTWVASAEQGKLAGLNMTGVKTPYNGTIQSNILKIPGIDLFSAGNIDFDNKFESKIYLKDNIYKKIVFDKNVIIGCLMVGDKKDFSIIVKAIKNKEQISEDKKNNFFKN